MRVFIFYFFYFKTALQCIIIIVIVIIVIDIIIDVIIIIISISIIIIIKRHDCESPANTSSFYVTILICSCRRRKFTNFYSHGKCIR